MRLMSYWILVIMASAPMVVCADSQGHPQAGQAGTGEPRRLATIELADQHGTNHVVTFPRDGVLLLAVADRRGSDQVNDWVLPVHRVYGSGLKILGVAHIGPVPGLLRGRILRELRRHYPYPILLDWTGEVREQLKFRSGEANVYLIDRDGHVLHHASGSATDKSLADLGTVIDRVLDRSRDR